MHIPILRSGKPYKSLNTIEVKDFRTGEAVAELSQANSGLIRKDFLDQDRKKAALNTIPVKDIIEMCKQAGELFMNADLLLDGTKQSPDDYIRILSSTTGMPESLCKINMGKVYHVMNEMEQVLGGLTRGLDLSILDKGWGEQNGRSLSYLVQANSLGAILPNNSPGVHTLWLPSIPLKVPLVLKPGSQEPWTPFRVIQAFIEVGLPAEAFGFYPTDYSGASEILLRSSRSMFFGDAATVKAWEKDHRVQTHGPGWSKVVFGKDKIDDWESYLNTMVDSISINSGRSCLNASGIRVPAKGREIAEALAQRLAAIEAKSMNDPNAKLAAFVNPVVAERISQMIDNGLEEGGAEDLTAKYRKGDRLVEIDGATILQPTLVWCDNPEHTLASSELLFPFASFVEVQQDKVLESMGPTLVCTAITEDKQFRNEILAAPNVDRLNFGAIPTSKISPTQPHEGNLFEHLYKQRALQMIND